MKRTRLRALSPPSDLQRRGKTCRLRGRNDVKPQLKQSNFSKDEDDLIFKLHALLGNRWSLIAGRLPGRTDNEVKIHWETYLQRKLIKMGIDPANHRLYHHTNYISKYLQKEHETKIISDQSSSVSGSCDMSVVPIPKSIKCSEDSTSTGRSQLPDLNISLVPTSTPLPARCFQSSQSSKYGSTGQETLLLFR